MNKKGGQEALSAAAAHTSDHIIPTYMYKRITYLQWLLCMQATKYTKKEWVEKCLAQDPHLLWYEDTLATTYPLLSNKHSFNVYHVNIHSIK